MVSVFLIYCLAGLLWTIYELIFRKRKVCIPSFQKRYLYNLPFRLFKRPPIPRYIRNEVFKRTNFACILCGSNHYLEVDHWIPFSKGGANDISNYTCLCRQCNRKKSNKIYG